MSPYPSKQPKQKISVALVCRPQLLRIGLERMLRDDTRLEVSSYASPPQLAVPADVVLICARGTKDIAAACEAVFDSTASGVVVMLDRPQPELLLDCLGAGASAFVTEHDDPGELLRAVRAAAGGDYHVAREPLAVLLDWHRAQRRSRSERSLARDRDLLALLASGRTTEEIAERLGIAPKTVRNRTSLLYRKLGVRSRAQALSLAEERGLLD